LLVNVIEAVFVHPFVPVVVTVYVPEELIAWFAPADKGLDQTGLGPTAITFITGVVQVIFVVF
jgi:hypothetical protein